MEILLVVLLIVSLAILAFNIVSYRGMRKLLTGQMHRPALEQKFVVQSIVDLKAGQTIIYSLLPVVLTLLGFLGYKAIDDVSLKVTKQVTDEIRAVSNFDSLKAQTERLDQLVLSTKEKSHQVSFQADEIRRIFDGIRRSPQKLFVVESLFVKKGKTRKNFAELDYVGGLTIAKLNEKPVLMCQGNGIECIATKDYVEIETLEDTYVNLWIYVK